MTLLNYFLNLCGSHGGGIKYGTMEDWGRSCIITLGTHTTVDATWLTFEEGLQMAVQYFFEKEGQLKNEYKG